MTDTPSAILNAAAARIRDAAKKAGAEHDCLKESCGGYADYRGHCGGCCSCLAGCLYEEPGEIEKGSWLDLMRPPVGLMLADWFEAEAACIASVDDVQRIMPKILDGIEPGAEDDTQITVTIDTSGPALAFARAILGSGVDTP